MLDSCRREEQLTIPRLGTAFSDSHTLNESAPASIVLPYKRLRGFHRLDIIRKATRKALDCWTHEQAPTPSPSDAFAKLAQTLCDSGSAAGAPAASRPIFRFAPACIGRQQVERVGSGSGCTVTEHGGTCSFDSASESRGGTDAVGSPDPESVRDREAAC